MDDVEFEGWLWDHRHELVAELRAGRAALIAAAIPLEALNMDNSNGAKWMAPSVKQHVAEAVTAIRAVLLVNVVGNQEEEK